MSTQTFINLPVRDLARATEFFTKLGFSFDPRATSESTACMVISDEAFAMLHVEPRFKEFIGQEITDTSRAREVIVGLTTDTREQVDELVERALAAGAQPLSDPPDQGFMYMRAFRDLDGHQWSFLHMDMSAL
jgi:predicted lactoylglutathione lyase